MDFKVVFKEPFIQDLEQIVRWIASENPNAARSLGNLIVARCESLSFFPERHPKVRQRTDIRRFVVRKNFKFFTVLDWMSDWLRFYVVGTEGVPPTQVPIRIRGGESEQRSENRGQDI